MLQTADGEDSEEAFTVWFLMHPQKNKTYLTWCVVLNILFWWDIITSPLFWIWPQYIEQFDSVLWFCDILWILNILISFITIRLDLETRDPLDIGMKYFSRMFIVDCVATFPVMVAQHSPNFMIFRCLHLFSIPKVLQPFDVYLRKLFSNSPHKRVTIQFFINYTAMLVLMFHYSVCVWLWVGDKYLMGDYHDPFFVANEDFHNASHYQLIVFSYYWMGTVFFTVGYGDYSGGTQAELLISIFFEFLGILMMSIVMYMIQIIVNDNDHEFTEFIDDKTNNLQLWINNMEKCNKPKHINPVLFYKMQNSLTQSFQYDFNTLLEEHTFYQRMTPKMQTELVDTLFSDFLEDFSHFFEGLERGFVNEFVINLYARSFRHMEDILKPGQRFDEVIFIIRGSILICEPTEPHSAFCVLPRHCFIGEYQILKGIAS